VLLTLIGFFFWRIWRSHCLGFLLSYQRVLLPLPPSNLGRRPRRLVRTLPMFSWPSFNACSIEVSSFATISTSRRRREQSQSACGRTYLAHLTYPTDTLLVLRLVLGTIKWT